MGNSLIANSGLHFITMHADINTEEPLILPDGKMLKYTFLETINFFNNEELVVDLCSFRNDNFVSVSFLRTNNLLEEAPNGTIVVDSLGVPKIDPKASLVAYGGELYPLDSPDLVNINSFNSLRFKENGNVVTGFEKLWGKWLPMPMYEKDITELSTGFPNGWCRVRIDPEEEKKPDGSQKFRLTWAFDTKLAEDLIEGIDRPAFLEGSGDRKYFSLCNRTDLLLGGFLNLPGGDQDSPITDYLISLLGIDINSDEEQSKFKFLGYYIYLINYLRLSGASPKITLYNNTQKSIPVDMSVDIGNSRTCAVLFEDGDFTKARMLQVRDMSEPWRTYDNAFDMRIVFRKADFGGDITIGNHLFLWPSIVRFGEEAKRLVYRSLQNNNESKKTTNYSSPKRYLWDSKPFDNRWDFLVTENDPTNLKVSSKIYLKGFTDYFDDDGTFLDEPKEFDLFNMDEGDDECHYSRSSLMNFVMIELLNQAFCFINSERFREMHGDIDCKRYLRTIVVTCPTAMPLKEQRVLRQAAKNATKILQKMIPDVPDIQIIPEPDKLLPTGDFDAQQQRGWLYDEAFSSQLVYLFAELVERYSGRIDRFLQVKGHQREDMKERGFDGNQLTIGTVDIGAGTTDVMVTSYGRKGNGRLTPIPLYYDSFYSAGDDIIHNIIRDIILEGPDNGSEKLGSIGNSLEKRIMSMSPDEIQQIPRVKDTKQYLALVEDMRHVMSEQQLSDLKHTLSQELMHHFFAEDSAGQSATDRITRLDFCTQISIPIAQFFLELLKQQRPTKLYSFDDIFDRDKPADYLFSSFEYHFGFDFRELGWRYDPKMVGNVVCQSMEMIIKSVSVVFYALNCDILVLSGRPTNLKPLTELFLKYIPLPPNRMVLLNQYHVGRWFPLSTQQGYFMENQKAVVAIGAEVGHLASTVGFKGLVLDFTHIAGDMKSTSCYIGQIDSELLEVHEPFLTPDQNTTLIRDISVFPYYIGCKQFDSPKYQARPLYAIYNYSGFPQLNIMLERNYQEDRENIIISDATNRNGDSVSLQKVELRLQTIGKDGCFWMDKGEFKLKIQEHV